MELGLFNNFNRHNYYVTATGINCKSKTFDTRKAAEAYMWLCCSKAKVFGLECTECDKHERKYSNHKGVRFYINRV